MSGWGRRRVYGYAHCSAREQRWGQAPLLFLGSQAPLPRPRPPHRLPATLAAAVLPPLCRGRCGSPGGPGGAGGQGRAQRTGRGRGPGAGLQTGAHASCWERARPSEVNETEKTGHVFTAGRTNSTGSAAPLPPPPARTAGHALAPPPHPPFLSWPERCSADGMRQRLLGSVFVPCWAGRSAGLAGTRPGGARLSRGRGTAGRPGLPPGGGARR